MQTTPETNSLLAELYERSIVVSELDGPQIEAWASGLFALFDDDVTASDFVAYCGERPSVNSTLVCMAIAELSDGIDDELCEQARAIATANEAELPIEAGQIGQSFLAMAWTVQAPFGRSIVLGFDNRVTVIGEDEDGEAEPVDVRHSVLLEIGGDETIEDIQLAGPLKLWSTRSRRSMNGSWSQSSIPVMGWRWWLLLGPEPQLRLVRVCSRTNSLCVGGCCSSPIRCLHRSS